MRVLCVRRFVREHIGTYLETLPFRLKINPLITDGTQHVSTLVGFRFLIESELGILVNKSKGIQLSFKLGEAVGARRRLLETIDTETGNLFIS